MSRDFLIGGAVQLLLVAVPLTATCLAFGMPGMRRYSAVLLVSLRWPAAWGMGLGLAQMGKFSFLILAEGLGQGVISHADYNRMLFIAMGTLILAPQLLKIRLRWAGE